MGLATAEVDPLLAEQKREELEDLNVRRLALMHLDRDLVVR